MVIANAAVAVNRSFLDTTPGDFDRQLKVNLSGSFYVAHAAAHIMAKQKPRRNGVRGKIVFASTFVSGRPLPNCCGYIASKVTDKAIFLTRRAVFHSFFFRAEETWKNL